MLINATGIFSGFLFWNNSRAGVETKHSSLDFKSVVCVMRTRSTNCPPPGTEAIPPVGAACKSASSEAGNPGIVICQQPICGNVWPYVCVLHTSCPLVLIGPVWTSSRTSSAVTTAGGYLGQPAAIFQKHGEVLSPRGQLFDGIFYKLP